MDVFVDNDLADTVKPGDRVRCAGVYRALSHHGGTISGIFRTVVLANSLAAHAHDETSMGLTSGDKVNIKEIVRFLASIFAIPTAPIGDAI